MMKQILKVLICLILFCALSALPALAENDRSGLMMEVVNCNEWVSLRADPKTNAERIAQVPLGAYVYHCQLVSDSFYYCEYDKSSGYILSKYLTPLSFSINSQQTQAAAETTTTSLQYYSLALSEGCVLNRQVLEGASLVASRTVDYSGNGYESMSVGLFDSEKNMVWGYKTSVQTIGQNYYTSVYYTQDANAPYVVLCNNADVMIAIDLPTGIERWRIDASSFMGVNAYGVAKDGTLYVSGQDPAMLSAVSLTGEILWQADTGTGEVYWPYQVDVYDKAIVVHYDVHEGNAHHVIGYSPTGERAWHGLRFNE